MDKLHEKGVIDYLLSKGVDVPKKDEKPKNKKKFTAIHLNDDMRKKIDSIFSEMIKKEPETKKEITTTKKTGSIDIPRTAEGRRKHNYDYTDCPTCGTEASVQLYLDAETGLIDDIDYANNKTCWSCGYALTDKQVDDYNEKWKGKVDSKERTLFDDDDIDVDYLPDNNNVNNDEEEDDVEFMVCPVCNKKYSVLVNKNSDGTITLGEYDCDFCGNILSKAFIDEYNENIIRSNKKNYKDGAFVVGDSVIVDDGIGSLGKEALTIKSVRNDLLRGQVVELNIANGGTVPGIIASRLKIAPKNTNTNNDSNSTQTIDQKCPNCNTYGITATFKYVNGKTKDVKYEPCTKCGYVYDSDVGNKTKKLKTYDFVRIDDALPSNLKHLKGAGRMALINNTSLDKNHYSLWVFDNGVIIGVDEWYPRNIITKTPKQDIIRAKSFVKVFEDKQRKRLDTKLRRPIM